MKGVVLNMFCLIFASTFSVLTYKSFFPLLSSLPCFISSFFPSFIQCIVLSFFLSLCLSSFLTYFHLSVLPPLRPFFLFFLLPKNCPEKPLVQYGCLPRHLHASQLYFSAYCLSALL